MHEASDTQYGNQPSPSYASQPSPFLSKPVPIHRQEQQRGRQEPIPFGNQMGGFASMQAEGFGVSPSSFLSPSHKNLPSTAMEIGTPPTGSGFAPPTAVKMETSALNTPGLQPPGHFPSTGTSHFHPPSATPSSGPITRSASDPLFSEVSTILGPHQRSPMYAHQAPIHPLPHPHPQHTGVFVSTQTQTSPPSSASLSRTSPVTTPLPPMTPSSSSFPFTLQQQHSTAKDSSQFHFSSPPPPLPQPQSYVGGGSATEYWSPQHSYPQRKSSAELQPSQQAAFTSPSTPPATGFPTRQIPASSEPLTDSSLQLLAEQMQQLERQQFQQLKEIEKQQSIATQQYLGLLHRYIDQSGSHTSRQQQQVLQSVLSDPSSVHILKTILLQEGAGEGERKGGQPQQVVAKPDGGGTVAGERQDGSLQQQTDKPGSQLLTPTQLAKVRSLEAVPYKDIVLPILPLPPPPPPPPPSHFFSPSPFSSSSS